MNPTPTIQSIIAVFPALPDSAIEENLVIFDALLHVSSTSYRPVVAGMLRSAAESASAESRKTVLLRAADAIAAGLPSGRTPDGLTAQEAAAKNSVMADQWQEPAAQISEPFVPPELRGAIPAPQRKSKPAKASFKAAEFKQLNTRKASVLQVGGFRPTFDPTASNFGMGPLGMPGEEWPTGESKPLLFVCQMNLASAPAVPSLLADIQLITFFVSPELGDLHRENGTNWQLRAYSSVDGLVRIAAPADAPKVKKGFECRWEECEDHPNHDDPEMVIPAGARRPRTELENVARTKIGGYASTIQSAPWWGETEHPSDPKYCLQINSEEKAGLFWGEGGTIYLARGTAPGTSDQWFLDWQCF
jgi:uncharacterized protein YwqG